MSAGNDISQAVQLLRAGALVAFPTETVYGLGADAANPQAVQKIYAAKGRPATNPLIVHVADETAARRYAGAWPAHAAQLAGAFWPGPLTLVLPRGPMIAPQVSAGRDTLAIRSPDHPLALQLLRAFDGPIAAPSANRSMRISPTTARHVAEELGGAVSLILDGGPCRVGIESTVLDLTRQIPTILRPGSITRAQIEALIGSVRTFQGSVSTQEPAASPGQHAIHYAPLASAYRINAEDVDRMSRWCEDSAGISRAALLIDGVRDTATAMRRIPSVRRITLPNMPQEYAVELYAALRELDGPDITEILVEMPPDEPPWMAVRDRLLRATRPLPDVQKSKPE